MPRKKLRVAACQIQAKEGEVEQNAEKVIERLKACAAKHVEVAAFQEGILYGYTLQETFWENLDQERLLKAERKIVRTCKAEGIAAVVGTTHVEDGTQFNSLLIVDRDGTALGHFGAVHAGRLWGSNPHPLTVYRLCGVDCCFVICHDVRYPELVRLPAAAGAQICFCCGCESPPIDEWKLAGHLAMPISRATEKSIYVVLADSPADPEDIGRPGSGHSQSKVIDPDGNVLAEAGVFTEEIVVWDLDLTAVTRAIARRAVNDDTGLRDWLREGLKMVERVPRPSGRRVLKR